MTNGRLALSFAVGALILNGGCGGGSSTSPSAAPAPTPVPAPVTTVLGQGTYQGPSGTTGPLPGASVTVSQAGTVTTTLRWTFASNDVDLFVLSGNTCTTHVEGVPTGAGCAILCQDTSVGGTTATCSFSSTTGTLLVWASNYGATSESGTWIVTLTR